LKFYAAAEGNTFAVGISPSSVVFDGSSIWVVNTADNTVSQF